jgi:type II secretory pathway component PulF
MPFSNALENHRDVFSNLSINVVRAGETSGNLRKAVEYVAQNLEDNYTLISRVKSALMYPAIILVVFFIIGFLVVSFILPKLTFMIKEVSAEVPWYTEVVIWVGDFMNTYWWAVLIIIVAFIGGIMYYIRTDAGRIEFDRIKIRLPIVGPIFRYVYISRFAENLQVLLSGGIPIIRALTIVSSVVNNVVYEAVILKTAEEVKVGGNIHTVLSQSAVIPPMVANMVKIGEESGQLESVLGHVYKYYAQETEVATKNLSTLIEPVLMIFIGIAVGFMAFAVLMPIYNIAGQIK